MWSLQHRCSLSHVLGQRLLKWTFRNPHCPSSVSGSMADEYRERSPRQHARRTLRPHPLVKLQGWAPRMFERATGQDALANDRLVHKLRKGVVITTHFSGIGTAEAATNYITGLQGTSGVGSDARGFAVFAVCDCNRTCRDVLMQLPDHHVLGSSHIFGDLVTRASPDLEESFTQVLEATKQEMLRHMAVGDCCAKLSLQDRFLEETITLVRQHMEGFTRSSRSWCFRHSRFCPTFPDTGILRDGWIHLEVAGTPCVSYSAMGKQHGVVHPSTLAMVVWAVIMEKVMPEVIIHENSSRFKVEVPL